MIKKLLHRLLTGHSPPVQVAEPAPEKEQPKPLVFPEPVLEVLNAQALMTTTGTHATLARARLAAGLNSSTWEKHVLPFIEHVAAFMQLLPASEAHHHAQPGGLWIHTIETLEYALRLRQGRLLPEKRDASEVTQHAHRWTFAVIVAAMLHDIGKCQSDLVVRLYNNADLEGAKWNALAGSMQDLGATHYAVDFPPPMQRDYKEHQKLGALFSQKMIMAETFAWLAKDHELVQTLSDYLSATADQNNPIKHLVSEGEQESVRQNLKNGSRTRFSTARQVPLIERLMFALRSMLAEGGHLPLNRSGAAGFVFEGDVWFAAVRLAEAVRNYLKDQPNMPSIPGADLNDRLYDTWQEYGACRINPKGGAIWQGKVELPENSFFLSAMIRFPLEKLYSEKSKYPAPMLGRIVIKTEVAEPGSHATTEKSEADQIKPTDVEKSSQKKLSEAKAKKDKATEPKLAIAEPPAFLKTSKSPQNKTDQKLLAPSSPKVETPAQEINTDPQISTGTDEASDPSVELNDLPDPSIELNDLPDPSVELNDLPDPDAEAAPYSTEIQAESDEEVFLDDEDCASAYESSSKKIKAIDTQTIKKPAFSPLPVTPAFPVPTHTADGKPLEEEASELLKEFMGWIQHGIADGSLLYNSSKAMIHFVKFSDEKHREQIVMMLVSPAIFKSYAEIFGDQGKPSNDPENDWAGIRIQRVFTTGPWHIKAKGQSVFRYQIARQGNFGGNLLTGCLVQQPERFINPLPPVNELLTLWNPYENKT